MLKNIKISDIIIPSTCRSISEYNLNELVESIQTYGLMIPIIVDKGVRIIRRSVIDFNLLSDETKYELIDGYYRLKACRLLGHDSIICQIYGGENYGY